MDSAHFACLGNWARWQRGDCHAAAAFSMMSGPRRLAGGHLLDINVAGGFLRSEGSEFCILSGLGVQKEDVTVTCVCKTTLGQRSQIAKRELHVHVVGESDSFVCMHYQMLSWPDHGAPGETVSIQELINTVNHVRPPSQLLAGILLATYLASSI
jgi:hypothetical protein